MIYQGKKILSFNDSTDPEYKEITFVDEEEREVKAFVKPSEIELEESERLAIQDRIALEKLIQSDAPLDSVQE